MRVEDTVRLLVEASRARGAQGTWLRVIERLLRACRTTLWWRDADAEARGHFERLVADLQVEFRSACGRLRSARVDEESAERLGTAIQNSRDAVDALGDGGTVALCRALALVLDEMAERTALTDRLRDGGELLLEPGSIYPIIVHQPDPTDILEGRPTSNPAALQDLRLDMTPGLALASDRVGRFRFVLDWDAAGRLSSLAQRQRLRMACCQPNLSLGEFDVPVGDGGEDGALEPWFRNRGPIVDGHRERLVSQVRTAAEAEADVVVFPEYTVPIGHRDAVERALHELDVARPSVVQGGSSQRNACLEDHVHDDDCPVVNEAVLWFRDGAATLRKLIPARVDGHTERIDGAGGEVRVFISGDWALCVLVCRDAMSADIQEQLRELGVNLLLVPAMSGRTTTLVQRATSLTTWRQAFTAIAVAPAVWFDDEREQERVQAAYHGPDEVALAPEVAPSVEARPHAELGVWLFDSRHRDEVDFRSSG